MKSEFNNILDVKNVIFSYNENSDFRLSIPELSLVRGRSTLLLGSSGSGKSTLLGLISGVLSSQSGEIYVQGQDITLMKPSKRDIFRANHIGIIFQQFNLIPFLSAADNILLSLNFSQKRYKKVRNTEIALKELFESLQLPLSVLNQKASALSVGQQQRVAVARALIGSPELIIADEPTSSLDKRAEQAFLELLFSLVKKENITLLMVSHNSDLKHYFDETLHIEHIINTEK